jgi:hypothetical protein
MRDEGQVTSDERNLSFTCHSSLAAYHLKYYDNYCTTGKIIKTTI